MPLVFCNTMYYNINMKNNNQKNKDCLLNIRISKKTYDRVKRAAEENKESISNLIRKVINDCLEITNDISQDIFNKTETNKISAYYQGVAAQNITCAQCQKKIKSGNKITIGETTNGKKYYFCLKCR